MHMHSYNQLITIRHYSVGRSRTELHGWAFCRDNQMHADRNRHAYRPRLKTLPHHSPAGYTAAAAQVINFTNEREITHCRHYAAVRLMYSCTALCISNSNLSPETLS